MLIKVLGIVVTLGSAPGKAGVRTVALGAGLPAILVALMLGLFGGTYLRAMDPSPRSPTTAGRELLGVGEFSSSSVAPLLAETSEEASEYGAVLDRYCLTCHNERLRTAGLVLDPSGLRQVGTDAEIWEKVVHKVRSRTMPPAGAPRPDVATYEALGSWLEDELDAAAAADPRPGPPQVRLLNRTEYANAVRDLLALEIDSRSLLPPDTLAYGFDNNADLLRITSGLLERYMSVARKVSRLAVGDLGTRPVTKVYRRHKYYEPDYRGSEDLPFGSRGGLVVKHHFPLDGEYLIKIRLRRYAEENILGLFEPQQVDVRLDGERIGLFTVDARDLVVSVFREDLSIQDKKFDVRVSVKAGMRSVGVSLLQRNWAVDGIGPSRLPVAYFYNLLGNGYAQKMGVGRIDISGPFNVSGRGDTDSRRRVFECRPRVPRDEEPCARQILKSLAARAYRRPAGNEGVSSLLDAYHEAREEGRDFDTGIQRALEQLLLKPEFLFRAERAPADVPVGAPFRLSDLELASRLSFFLWSSLPDDKLVATANQGHLSDPAVLVRQVRRMMADDRSRALVKNFASQWLHLRNMEMVRPDVAKAFPEFDENLRDAFSRETELFLEAQLREDRSIVELLTADYSFVNERLARHYGISGVYGSHFRRVTYPTETRGGLLGHGSILTVSSYATRTSPVMRGHWVLENILNTPPPPPPPDVPGLPEREEEGEEPRTMRELMERHRENPACAACHAQMDPIGFALENFDAVGKWRTHEGGVRIDAVGALPDGTRLEGVAGLRRVLYERREEFVATVVTKLLTYALGRNVEYFDMPAVRKIVREAEPNGYRWSSIIQGIVGSVPFQMGRLGA